MATGIITAVLLLLFVAGWVWIWNPRLKSALDAASRLPLDDDAASAFSATHRHEEQKP